MRRVRGRAGAGVPSQRLFGNLLGEDFLDGQYLVANWHLDGDAAEADGGPVLKFSMT